MRFSEQEHSAYVVSWGSLASIQDCCLMLYVPYYQDQPASKSTMAVLTPAVRLCEEPRSFAAQVGAARYHAS